MYKCGWQGCEKAYGTLNHLNAHVTMQSHGQKRTPEGMFSFYLLSGSTSPPKPRHWLPIRVSPEALEAILGCMERDDPGFAVACIWCSR